MNDLDTNSSGWVTLEIFPHLKEDDFDLLILFLESKRQSGGGDISNVDDLTFANVKNGKMLKICYEDCQVAQRVVFKKFLKFKNYRIRSLPGSISSFKSETFDILANKLIIQNICADSDDDESIVEMYADYLDPFNEIIHLEKSNLSSNTFIVTFKDELNRESLNVRFNKKRILRKKEIFLMDSFNTKSFLIFSPKKQETDFGHLIQKLNSELANSENSNEYFIELNAYSFMVQFNDEKLFNEIFNIFKFYLKSINLDLIIERVYNFVLVESFSDSNKIVENSFLDRKFIEVGVQTDFLPESSLKSEETISNLNCNSELKEKHTTISTLNVLESSNDSSINETRRDHLIELNIEDCYSIALLNVKQLFFNFQEELKKISPNLELINSDGKLFLKISSLKDSNKWKTKTLSAIIVFFEKKALYKTIEIPTQISNSPDLISKLNSKVQEYNKLCPALYFKISGQNIQGFGCKKILKNKSSELSEFINLISTQPNSNLEPVQAAQEKKNAKILINSDSLAYEALWNIKQIFFDFKNNVKSIGADLVISENNKLAIVQKDYHNLNWEFQAKDYIDEFEKKQLKKISVTIPANIRKQKKIVLLRNELKQHEKFLGGIKIELIKIEKILVFGYCKTVDIISKKIDKLFECCQSKFEQSLTDKLLIVINKKKSVDYKILQGFSGKYFKQFSENLIKISAILTAYYKSETDNGFKIFSNLDKNEQQDKKKVFEWNQKVLECTKRFFDRFTRQVIQLRSGNTLPDKIDFDPEKVILELKSDSQVDILGEKNEVERVKQFLIKKQKLSESSDSDSELNFSNSNERTFLINDLKWFQVRILFEEQFFKHLSDNYKDLNVMLDTQLTRICLSGEKKHIKKAKKMAFKILDKILGAEIECDTGTLDKIQKNEKQLLSYLKDQNLKCVVDTKSNTDKLIVYSTKLQDIEKFKSIFSNFKL